MLSQRLARLVRDRASTAYDWSDGEAAPNRPRSAPGVVISMLLLFRCVRVAGLADDAFGRLIAVGVAVFILFQVFVNIGVNIRLLPVTGVPLPLVSQGGSSLVTIMAALGILQSILGHRRKRSRT